MITGIILAGGKSTRCATNKLTLLVNKKPLILHTIESMTSFVDKIIVVTGKYHNELKPILKDVEVVYNKDFELGMFSSICAGVRHVEGNFFVLPGDCPFVKKETFKSLLSEGNFLLRVPTYKGETGHPILIHSSLKKKILNEPLTSNLKKIRDEIGFEKIEVNDPNILNDIDTLINYKTLVEERKSYES